MKDIHDTTRLRILFLLFFLVAVIMVVRIFYLATLSVDEYEILQDNQNIVKRGDIVDRNNRILAVNDELFSIYANPKEITDSKKAASVIAGALSMKYAAVYGKLVAKKNFIWLKRQVSPGEYSAIIKEPLKGIHTVKEYKRIYPNRSLASHILGFCNIDNQGVEGVEKSLDRYLLYDTDQEETENRSNGLNVQLTIDATIQAAAELSLQDASEREGAEIGSLILADGLTGEILAMANTPYYDPNYYASYPQKNFRNNSIFYQYEPGSVFKLFSIAAILDNGGIDQTTQFYCDGIYENGPYKVRCTGVHHWVSIREIFKYSCNDGTLQAAERIKNFELYHYLKAFGFGEMTGVELPGEQQGVLRKVANWTPRSMLAVPIGQEVSVNALQIVQAATTFLNDGVMLNMHVVKKIYDNNGKAVFENGKKEIRRVLSPGIGAKIIDAMGDSTKPGGSVSRLKVEGVNFAAKSGTAQIFDTDTGKYSNKEVSASLIAIFPIESPRYIAYATFHKPTAAVNWGGIICSDLLNKFLGDITGYLDINPPAYTVTGEELLMNPAYERIKTLPARMPDLSGLSGGDALDIFSETSIEIRISGAGRIYRQEPVPGDVIDQTTTIKLYLQ